MVSITVDNINIKISSHSTVLEACHYVGVMVPRFCFHKKLSIAGNCRMCIVEIEKFPKPVSSCTLKVSEGMRIFTKTPLVRKAQETVLEFLLINHPLDCPICDQGGECDLQDQLNFFGSDSSRFFQLKRGVSDKNCSPFVKTIMTRCIHCTRCVRFLSDVAGDRNFGMLGRSSQAEIGCYISGVLKSEFSGNIIDLCPVGALTSKPYSFKGRSWELINYKTIDVLDSINSDIIVSFKGSEILRVLPCFTSYNISEWISDKTRFFYDSFDFLRIKKCWLRERNSFINWSSSLSLLYSLLSGCFKKNKKLGFFLGSLSDLETIIYSKYLCNFLGSSDVYSDFNCGTSADLSFRSDYSFNSRGDLSKSDLCLVLGSNLRIESPNLNLLIGNYVKKGSLILGYVGPSLDLSYPATHIGLDSESVISLIKGTHPFCFYLKRAKNPYIIVGEKFNFSSIISYIYKLFNLGCLPNLKYSNISILRSKSASISFSELGINSLQIKKDFDILFLLGVNDLQPYRVLNPKSFIIYLGSHYSVNNLEMADLILPASIFLEKDFKVINFENVLKSSKSLRKISSDVRPEWYLLLVLIFLFKSDLNCLKLDKKNILNSLFTFEYPFLKCNLIHLPVYNILNFANSGIQKEIFNCKIFDFYRDNMLTRSSKNFKYSVNNFKQVQFKKK